MDKRLVAEVLKARKAVKKKYETLKFDIAKSTSELQQQFKPITEPLKELITTIKTEQVQPKYEFPDISQIFVKKPKRRVTSTPIAIKPQQPTFLDPELIGEVGEDEDENIPTADEYEYIPPADEYEHVQTLDELRQELLELGTTPGFEEYISQYEGLARTYAEGLMRDVDNLYDTHYGVRFIKEKDKFYVGNSQLDFQGQDIVVTPPDNMQIVYKGTPGLYELLFKKHPIGYNKTD